MKVVWIGLVAVVSASLGFASRADRTVPSKKTDPIKLATYSANVGRILNDRCVSCHRPGEVAPFSLVGYENAKKWSGTIARVAEARQMPPWKAVHGYGEFQDENRLSIEEISALKQWAESGAPVGNKNAVPPTPKFKSNWTLGEPDLILTTKRPFKLGAEGQDVYRNFVIKTDFKETKWVRAIDVRPGNTKVVHHVIAYLDKGTNGARREAATSDGQEGYVGTGGGVGFLPSGSFGGWAPGVRPKFAPTGTAFRLDPGTTIVMQIHYHKSGKEETDQTKLALYFDAKPPERELFLDWALDFRLNITPGKKDYKIRTERTIPVDATIYNTLPHMHLLGKSMKSWFQFPDGTIKPLINVEDWDFNWQLVYTLKTPMKVPAGTKHFIEATYDNSSENLRNPSNPPRRVTWGEETTDEMFLLVSSYTFDRKEDAKTAGFMLGRAKLFGN